MKTKITILTLFIFFKISSAQQNPQYTQYMYNMRSVNPAYMINEPGIIEIGGIYRSQWQNIIGAPKTANFFVSIPLKNKLEAGVSFYNDRIGSNIQLVTNTLNIDGAYKVKLNKKIDLSVGLKLGFNSINLNTLNSNVKTDPFFTNNSSKTDMNIGTGIFLFSDNFYFGLSIPNFLKDASSSKSNHVNYTNSAHFYSIGGYIFKISNQVKLKPSFIIKYVNGVPLSFDISANTLIYNKFELGVAYRNQDAISALACFYLTPNLKFGYAYDIGISNLNNFHSGSHEIVAIYKFDVLGITKKYMSPRFY